MAVKKTPAGLHDDRFGPPGPASVPAPNQSVPVPTADVPTLSPSGDMIPAGQFNPASIGVEVDPVTGKTTQTGGSAPGTVVIPANTPAPTPATKPSPTPASAPAPAPVPTPEPKPDVAPDQRMEQLRSAEIEGQFASMTPAQQEEVLALERQGVKRDAAIGTVLGKRLGDVADDTLDTPAIGATADMAKTEFETVGEKISDAEVKLSEQSEQAYDKAFNVLNEMAATAQSDREQSIRSIEAARNVALERTAIAQRQESGASSKALARLGGYLGGTGSGTAYMNSLAQFHRLEVADLEAKFAAAVEKAKVAHDQKNIDLANQLMQTASSYEEQINEKRRLRMEEALTTQELLQFERETDLLTLKAWAEQGYTVDQIPEGIFAEMDKAAGYRGGTTKGLYSISKREIELENVKDEAEMRAFEIQQAQALVDILASVPAGTPIEIGGHTYYGTKGIGDLQINKQTGDAKLFTVDQATGQIMEKYVGNLGPQPEDWQLEYQNGEYFMFNPTTKEFMSVEGAKADLNTLIPAGVYDGIPGEADRYPDLPLQCGEFVRWMTGSNVGGDTLADKKKKIDESIDENNAVAGNTIVFNAGTTGHVAVINDVYVDGAGRRKFVLSEANWRSPGEVTHDREVYADDPSIVGYQNTSIKSQFNVGPDSSTAAALQRVRDIEAAENSDSVSAINWANPDLESVASRLVDLGKNKDIRGKTPADIEREWERSVATGDPTYIREEILTKVLQGKFAADKNATLARVATKRGLGIMKEKYEQFEREGKDLNIFTGTYEDILNKIGETNDPDLLELKSFIGPMLMDYRRQQTGVAFSETENKQYTELFPGIKQTPENFYARIRGLVSSMENADTASLQVELGMNNYKKFFEENPLGGDSETGGDTWTSSSGNTYDFSGI